MTLHQFYRQQVQQFPASFSPSLKENILQRVFEDLGGWKRTDWLTENNLAISPEKQQQLTEALHRIHAGEPVQYVTGTEYFFRLPFTVTSAVLIPRPETEELVQLALDSAGETGRMLDVGTGSGCIAIAFKVNRMAWDVVGVDISTEALMVAEINNAVHKAGVHFLQADFLTEQSAIAGNFNLIISNPPYIPKTEMEKLDQQVRLYEPAIALFVEEAQLFYRALADFGKTHLHPNGKVLMEVHQDFAEETALLFQQEGYTASVKKDISGNNRMVVASLTR